MIVLDDFGCGLFELCLLYDMFLEYVKIDWFFLNGIESDLCCKLFVIIVVNLVYVLGVCVIVEGVEIEWEFKVCWEVGCDLIQGYFVVKFFDKVIFVKLFYDYVRVFGVGLKRKDE